MARIWAVAVALAALGGRAAAQPHDNDINHALFSKDVAGHLVWTVMHLYSAYVPEAPSAQERAEIGELYRLL